MKRPKHAKKSALKPMLRDFRNISVFYERAIRKSHTIAVKHWFEERLLDLRKFLKEFSEVSMIGQGMEFDHYMERHIMMTTLKFQSQFGKKDDRALLGEAVLRERRLREKCKTMRYEKNLAPILANALRLQMNRISFFIAEAEILEIEDSIPKSRPISRQNASQGNFDQHQ